MAHEKARAEPVPRRASGHARPRPVAVAALLLTALNLRPAVTSLGPVLQEVRRDLGMSATVAGLLTSMPVLCFAVVGFTASRLAARHGSDRVVLAGMAAVAAGLLLRLFAGGGALFLAASALALAGIAVANVLLPAVVKERFPTRVGAMTGLYSMALNLGASSAAAATVPLARTLHGDWRAALGCWALLAAVAVPPWLALRGDRARPVAPGTRDARRLARDPVAWALAGYFALQATAAYVVIGWLPQIFRDAGLSAETAGLLFSVTSVLGVPLSFALAAAAGRLRGQSALAAVLGAFGLAGYAGLWAAPAALPWLWAILLGVANCSFPLALTMIGLRGRDGPTVARLSTFAQSVGYLLAVPGPIAVGALYQHTGGWGAPLAFLAVLMLPQIATGVLAGRDREIA
ncbi:MFS transporter [Actinomadura rayongensis]|uniref:MFS transporter n=1 Tax=Actinomadura rayongensis TaxID=1429076 RepID=A0A6I4W3U9_9ACTN|nr:MFS transporter [Actinomadura rayongensis]